MDSTEKKTYMTNKKGLVLYIEMLWMWLEQVDLLPLGLPLFGLQCSF